FLELCKTPSLCAEVMLRTVDELQVDAAILFSDLLLILEAMGLDLRFDEGRGPIIDHPITKPEDLDRLHELETLDKLGYVFEAVSLTRAGLDTRLPLLGFAGAPFTLASYAIEGGASRDHRKTKTLMLNHPATWHALMERLARAVARFLDAQLDAGAQAVQLFDSWVGCLGPDDYRRFVLPHTQAAIGAIKRNAPVVHFAVGNPALLPLLREAGGDVIGIDWRIGLDEAWRLVGRDRAVQGNLDPVVLLTRPDEIRRRVQEILNLAGDGVGHIFNLGHGVLPQTPVENVVAMVEAVHHLSRR
ncbi:MAG: uroporphyrinogen decarboxylase, partial [Pirellulaceae bacterium]|nr:uroporphyrinogen decarboxylase [Pirellulaceae bacterium]